MNFLHKTNTSKGGRGSVIVSVHLFGFYNSETDEWIGIKFGTGCLE